MMMAKRSQKIPEMKEKTESKCKWGLLSIFESCHVRPLRRKLISNGRSPLNQQIIEYPRKPHNLTRFDEECQRFQENVPVEKLVNKEPKSKVKSEATLVDDRGKMSPKKVHHSRPLASSSKKVTFAELLRTVPPNDDDDNPVEPSMSEDLRRSSTVRKHDEVNSCTNRVAPMNVRALVDQMFTERRLKDRSNSECKSFSDALEVLNSAKISLSDKKEGEASKGKGVINPESKNPKYTETVPRRCSSVQESDSFSFKKMKKRLKRRFAGPNGPGPVLGCGDAYVLPQTSGSEVGDEEGLFSGAEIKSCNGTKTKEKLRKRPDFQEFDVISEAKRHLSSRLENTIASKDEGTCKKRPQRTLARVLMLPEHEFRSLSLSPKKDILSFMKEIDRHRTCISPSRTGGEAFDREEESSVLISTGEEESHDATGEPKIATPKSTSASKSTASIIQQLEIADTSKYQEEHQSPVSVLEVIFTEEANSPQRNASHRDKQGLHPIRLDFEEQGLLSTPRDQPISDHISLYVQSVLRASRSNWDFLSENDLPPEETELVAESLFDEVEFPLTDLCYFDPKLLFNRVNEVLLYLHGVHRCSPFEEPRIRRVELEKAVIEEVMNQAEFFVLPRMERRNLDQLVSEDVRKCRSWLDVTRIREQIVIDISDDVLEDSIVDILF